MSTQDQLINKLIEQLKGQGAGDLQSRTALESEYTMRMIGGHVPDVSATIDNGLHLYAVVTEEVFDDDHAPARWRAFADYAKRGAATLHIAVEQGQQALAGKVPEDVRGVADIVEV